MSIRDELNRLDEEMEKSLNDSENLSALDQLRVHMLGKKGQLTALLRMMGQLTAEERPQLGQLINERRERFTRMLDERQKAMQQKEREMRLQLERIELDLYNFELLNIPKNHPARDAQDTFYIDDNVVLRTHTSPVQARTMTTRKPPIRIICPGRVYRADEVDATHSPVFHQIEGLVIDEGVSMGDLKATLAAFARRLYGSDIHVRFRPSFFPFTEPSAEADLTCVSCRGKGCRICKGTGWIEVLGCGMVNPHVLEMCGIDPKRYSGFAFGIGLERITMLRYGIKDMRLMYEGDLRFLRQFREDVKEG